ncbi:hypothetical protein DFJ77DRAFT_436615 [Powellomyces hirtus]|nr:hypothetical protein DFJ77DRAFT_436615 [Powellomyces hirtus]
MDEGESFRVTRSMAKRKAASLPECLPSSSKQQKTNSSSFQNPRANPPSIKKGKSKSKSSKKRKAKALALKKQNRNSTSSKVQNQAVPTHMLTAQGMASNMGGTLDPHETVKFSLDVYLSQQLKALGHPKISTSASAKKTELVPVKQESKGHSVEQTMKPSPSSDEQNLVPVKQESKTKTAEKTTRKPLPSSSSSERQELVPVKQESRAKGDKITIQRPPPASSSSRSQKLALGKQAKKAKSSKKTIQKPLPSSSSSEKRMRVVYYPKFKANRRPVSQLPSMFQYLATIPSSVRRILFNHESLLKLAGRVGGVGFKAKRFREQIAEFEAELDDIPWEWASREWKGDPQEGGIKIRRMTIRKRMTKVVKFDSRMRDRYLGKFICNSTTAPVLETITITSLDGLERICLPPDTDFVVLDQTGEVVLSASTNITEPEECAKRAAMLRIASSVSKASCGTMHASGPLSGSSWNVTARDTLVSKSKDSKGLEKLGHAFATVLTEVLMQDARKFLPEAAMYLQDHIKYSELDQETLPPLFSTRNHQEKIHTDSENPEAWALGYAATDGNVTHEWAFVYPEYGIYLVLDDDLMWAWKPAKCHGTACMGPSLGKMFTGIVSSHDLMSLAKKYGASAEGAHAIKAEAADAFGEGTLLAIKAEPGLS